ncbi:MAG: leucyl aminopeptidase [Candidatus Levybacteria bacterium CG10_big_fil_rev_8_21_14_0_10_35_13]|nr:MAG: leucyl aminopeptidase [Candidatus Levybacteria bacterium CG10_big_fil_rev_8_21_14_0_10_35_13]
MDPKIIIKNELDIQQKILVLGLFEGEKKRYADVNKELHSEILAGLSRKSFSFEFNKSMSTKISNSAYDRIIVISLGKYEEFTLERVRKVASKILKTVKNSKYFSLTTNLAELSKELFSPRELGRAVAEGVFLSNYSFDTYLSSDKKNNEALIFSIQYTDKDLLREFEKGIKEGEVLGRNTNLARDLVNEPPNVLTPSALETKARKLFSGKKNVSVKVLNKSDLKKLGMNALLGVGSGGFDDPRLIIIEYKNSTEKPLALVGKGITFDSGGYNIKLTGYMEDIEDMKLDMAGAAAVICAINSLQELNVKTHIVGIIPTCENLISGSAYKPGDIIKTYSGKTVEIGNTDAEGRLVLADALSYVVEKYSPRKVIDIATLTGATVVALGYYAAALISNDNTLALNLKSAGDLSNDRVWALPFFDDYLDAMDGDVSDFNNMSKKLNRAAGAITGGVFLSKFVNNTSWAHIDIGGTAYLKEAKDYNPKYASGAGVRLLSYFVLNESK